MTKINRPKSSQPTSTLRLWGGSLKSSSYIQRVVNPLIVAHIQTLSLRCQPLRWSTSKVTSPPSENYIGHWLSKLMKPERTGRAAVTVHQSLPTAPKETPTDLPKRNFRGNVSRHNVSLGSVKKTKKFKFEGWSRWTIIQYTTIQSDFVASSRLRQHPCC